MRLNTKIGIILSALVVLAGSFGIYKIVTAPKPLQTYQQQLTAAPPTKESMVGATIPVAVSRYETSLQSKIMAAATSMTLNSDPLFDKTGTYLTGTACFTIDEGNTNVEDVCGTASGTAITNMTRGLSPVNGTSTIVALEFEHRKGASVKITDSPQILIISRILNGNEAIPNILKYDSTVASSSIASNNYNLVDVALLNSIAFNGSPNATTTIQGLVQAGTITQLSASVQNGSTGAVLFAPGSLFASSSPGSSIIPVTQSTGKLNANFIDQTAAYTWTGLVIFNTATTTFNAPAVFTASTTIDSRYAIGAGFTHMTVFTASSTFAVPSGVKKVKVRVAGGGGSGGTATGNGAAGGGGAGGYGEKIIDVSATSTITVTVGVAGGTTSFSSFCSATGGSNGSATSGSQMGEGGAGGTGSGCDLNISGGAGTPGPQATGPLYAGGTGGSNPLGGGGTHSSAGGNYGGGGGGGENSGAGGTGALGVVIVEW